MSGLGRSSSCRATASQSSAVRPESPVVHGMCEVRLMRCDRLKWQRQGLRGPRSGPGEIHAGAPARRGLGGAARSRDARVWSKGSPDLPVAISTPARHCPAAVRRWRQVQSWRWLPRKSRLTGLPRRHEHPTALAGCGVGEETTGGEHFGLRGGLFIYWRRQCLGGSRMPNTPSETASGIL